MRKLKNLWTSVKTFFSHKDDNDDDRLTAFEGDLYEDLREEIAEEIEKDKMDVARHNQIMDKIRLGLELTNAEQRDTGFIQY